MCVWVWPVGEGEGEGEGAAPPGVLREGLGEGAGPAAQPGPGPRWVAGLGSLRVELEEVAERPGSWRAEEIGRGCPRAGQGGGTGVRGPRPSQGAAPTSGGGNGQEWA